jgi:hypothetical protein
VASLLSLARRVRDQERGQRGSRTRPARPQGLQPARSQVECIGKGKASAPYEFGVKVSIVTTNARAPGGQFVLHTKALPGNPYDGHTLATVIEATERASKLTVDGEFRVIGCANDTCANERRQNSSTSTGRTGYNRPMKDAQTIAADLTTPERHLLFCLASDTELEAAVTKSTIAAMIIRGLIQSDPLGRLSLTKRGRSTLDALLRMVVSLVG